MSIYLPLVLVLAKKPHQPASPTWLLLQTYLWDYPLFLWMRICHHGLATRALPPFVSIINEDLAIGSAPFASDVPTLYARRNTDNSNEGGAYSIGAVVNMCREYSGPLAAYQEHGIISVTFPTPDLCEPSYEDVINAVAFMRTYIKTRNKLKNDPTVKTSVATDTSSSESETTNDQNNGHNSRRVLVHCKAGRGRSVCIALCYLLSVKADSFIKYNEEVSLKGWNPNARKIIRKSTILEEFSSIQMHRDIAESWVPKCKVIQRYVLLKYSGWVCTLIFIPFH